MTESVIKRSSYGSFGSGSGIYEYEYEYEFITSRDSAFITSFYGSHHMQLPDSARTDISTSLHRSISASMGGSLALSIQPQTKRVLGYGINLI